MVVGNRNVFSMGSESLVKIWNLDTFISANSMSLCDYYNKDGGLILTHDRRVPPSLRNLPIFVRKAAYDAIIPPEAPSVKYVGEAKPKISPVLVVNAKLTDDKNLIQKATEAYGLPIIKIATQALDGVEEILTAEKMTKKTLAQAQEIVEETFKFDKSSISGCVVALQKIDSYTYNHSFGVYLLFSQALEDFKGYIDKPVFYDVFKSLNNNVNFNTPSIKKYATAALLHDFGKRNIPKEILRKNAKLTDKEYDIIKYHPKIAVKEMYELGFDDVTFLEIVGNHHRDYLTFPKKGQSPLAQICNILDIYEACRSKRPYKDLLSYNETQNILLSEKQEKHVIGWDPFLFVTLLKTTLPKFEKKRI